jgi:UDP:flavonoid glycosyltransferase YjiC (YdhE family)
MGPKRFLFVMGEGGGNVPPQLGLARKLVSRGHEVRVLTEPAVEADVRTTGASYVSFTKAPHRSDRSRESDFVRDFEAKTPIGTLAAFRNRVIFGPARGVAEDTMAEIDRWQPHVVAPDWIRTGAAVASEAAGIPTALLVHGNNFLPEPGKAPPGFGFLPATSVLGRGRDWFFGRIFLRLFNKGLPALNEARRSCGLPPLDNVLKHFTRPARFLCLYSEAFDLPANEHPANLRYVGPVLEEPAWSEPWSSPWPSDDRRPLVVISMSTTFMAQERAMRRCIEAVSAMPVRGLVTVGPALDPATFPSVQNVLVVQSAPHDEVFPRADAIITHAGMGTVNRALANGLPLLCMPMGRDQHDIAARVRWHGAGLQVASSASLKKIRASLDRLVSERSFREAAGRLRLAIEADLNADRGVAELESLAVANGD